MAECNLIEVDSNDEFGKDSKLSEGAYINANRMPINISL